MTWPWKRLHQSLPESPAQGEDRPEKPKAAIKAVSRPTRRGKKRAAVAVAHTILTIIYHILRTGRSYEELGGNFFDKRDKERIARRQVARLERLGYHVTLEPVPA